MHPGTPRPTLLLIAATVLLPSCGGSSSPAPSPSPETYHAAVNVFYDQDGNGIRDTDEVGVVPNATVEIGGATGESQPGTGRAEMDGAVAGLDPVTFKALPPFYVASTPISLTVPQPAGIEVYAPLTLPIGNNVPGLYMGFGDSITVGDGSYDNQGYRPGLQSMLQGHFGMGELNDQGIEATRSNDGAARIDFSLGYVKPAYTLILYGTNDWNDQSCREAFPCFTVDSLRSIVRSVKAHHSLPILSAIIPCNTGYDARTPPERNVWVSDMNDLIKPMAAEEGAVFVDMYAAFMAVPDFHALFSDHVHPNDAGYKIMAEQWFAAITTPQAKTQAREVAPPRPRPADRYYGSPGREMGRYEE